MGQAGTVEIRKSPAGGYFQAFIDYGVGRFEMAERRTPSPPETSQKSALRGAFLLIPSNPYI
jgi:hypothetical protein